MTSDLNSSSFSAQLHTTFQVHVPEIGILALELIEVTEKNYSPKLEQFCLIFRGPRDPWFPQQTCTIEHDSLGKMDLFIVPVGPDDQGMCYQVVFNRFRK